MAFREKPYEQGFMGNKGGDLRAILD